jgi:hypothetical protein
MWNSSIKKTIKFIPHPKEVMDMPNNVTSMNGKVIQPPRFSLGSLERCATSVSPDFESAMVENKMNQEGKWSYNAKLTCATGQAAKKKCKERELLKLAYWKINRPK